MILNLIELRNEFENLKKIRINIINYFGGLSDKISLLTRIYGKYIKQQENVGTILFGLDALHFQTFLINFEYDSMKNMHVLIENKLYCEYYKLFKLIINYVKSEIDEPNILKACENKKKYPVYKDLEQYKVYEFELINNLHNDILLLIELMNEFVIKKEKELEIHETNTINGLNLHIVVNTIDFNITSLKQKIKLYINYLKAFHKYHTTYLSRLNIKIGIMFGQINKDIKLEGTSTPNSETKQDIKRFPSLTNLQQEELSSFIEAENNIVKDEFNDIITNISDENDSDREKTDKKEISEDSYDSEMTKPDEENITENNINILFIDNNKDITMDIMNDIYNKEDIGDLSSDKLQERWQMTFNQSQMLIEDANVCEIEDDSGNISDDNCQIIEVKNEQDELNKWREIINNPDMSQEEKTKEKAKLKRARYKINKKNKKLEQ